ncbi:esterase [Paraconexibacter sp. AEG42_29]|uniref:Esterase n=1 Tax=Paraconexibacter sp. AEG42_29 TaxID=2997339 RepID=A0AAU7AR19_9ACTN
MSSLSGFKRADGQRLSPRLAALCGPSTLTLNFASRHPNPAVRAVLDQIFPLVGFTARGDATMTEVTVDGADGPIPARLYEPDARVENPGLLVHFHGGGFAVGSLTTQDNVCRFTARHAGCKVLAIGYRKAPEHRLPAAFEDCRAAFRWAVEHAAHLGVDPDRIAVGGDSAGGQLAAAVALHTDGGPKPCFAFLMYPVVDADINAHESAWLFERGPLLSRRNAKDLLDHYVPTEADRTDPRMSILHADGLGAMPPTFVATAGMDPLRDQGEAFAARLREAGVTVESERFDNLPHGFNLLLIDPQASAAYARCCDALTRALTP